MIGKHVHNNRESREGQILQYAREVRKLSLKDVADKIQLKAMDIQHYENGRRFYTPEELDMFLKMYEFDKEDFKSLLEMKMINKQIISHYMAKNKV
jgi:ribosome-binding protein aMBF1 (putative translation factor)